MISKKTRKIASRNEMESSLANGILISFAIVFGVFFQVGHNIYASNLLLKIIGILLPAILALLSLSFGKSRANFNIGSYALYFFILYFAYQIYLALSSPSFGRYLMGTADRNLGGIISCIAILGYLTGVFLNNRTRVWVLCVLGLTALVQTGTVFFQKFLKADVLNYQGQFESPAIFGTFYNANPLSYFLGVVASGFFGYLICTKWRSKLFAALAISMSALILGLNWSASSQGLIGLVAVVILFTVQKIVPSFQRKFHTLLSLSYVIALVVFFIVIIIIPLDSNSDFRLNPYLERLEIYKSALKITSHNLFTGVGIDNFASQYGTYSLSKDLKLVDNAHSIPLQLLSTQGIVGFLFYLAFTLFILRLKPKEEYFFKSNWTSWQAMFFAGAIIAIIGIEHPVISILSFISAGNLMCMSDRNNSLALKKISVHGQKSFKVFALILSITMSSSLLYYAGGELRTSIALKKLSNRTITPNQFVFSVGNKYQSIYSARVLLTTGQAFIAIENRLEANNIRKLMLSRYPDDQRTSVLLFAIAEKWNDSEALSEAIRLKAKLFPNSR